MQKVVKKATLISNPFYYIVKEVKISYPAILIGIVISMVQGVVLIIMLRLLPGKFLIWFYLIITTICFGIFGFLCYLKFQIPSFGFSRATKEIDIITNDPYFNYKYLHLYMAAFIWIWTAIFFLYHIYNKNRIIKIGSLMKTTEVLFKNNCSFNCFPIIFTVISITFLMYCIGSTLYLYSCGIITSNPKATPYNVYIPNLTARSLIFSNIVFFLLGMVFLMGIYDYVSMATASYWYFK
jgi:hypothetical protein